MRLSERLTAFYNELDVALIIEPSQVEALAKKAIRFYCGYAKLTHYISLGGVHPENDSNLDQDTCLSESEWAIISPLFEAYVEYANAYQIEATGGLGVDQFGRDTSTIQSEVNELEEALPKKAFYRDAETI